MANWYRDNFTIWQDVEDVEAMCVVCLTLPDDGVDVEPDVREEAAAFGDMIVTDHNRMPELEAKIAELGWEKQGLLCALEIVREENGRFREALERLVDAAEAGDVCVELDERGWLYCTCCGASVVRGGDGDSYYGHTNDCWFKLLHEDVTQAKAALSKAPTPQEDEQ